MAEYAETLIGRVLELSKSKDWKDAVNEWKIILCVEDSNSEGTCVCGEEGLRYLHILQNSLTGRVLCPVGLRGIKIFGRDDLSEQAKIQESLFNLLHAEENGTYIRLSLSLFSAELLQYLYEQGAFPSSEYNKDDGYNDYRFLVVMYNKIHRAGLWKKSNISKKQYKRITAIILNSIMPYLRENLIILNREK